MKMCHKNLMLTFEGFENELVMGAQRFNPRNKYEHYKLSRV